MVVTLLEMVISVNLEHPKNATYPMVVAFSVFEMETREEHLKKQPSGMAVMLVGIVNVEMPLSAKAYFPMLVAVIGTGMD